MLENQLIYHTPRVDVLEILPESVLASSLEDPVVQPEIDW